MIKINPAPSAAPGTCHSNHFVGSYPDLKDDYNRHLAWCRFKRALAVAALGYGSVVMGIALGVLAMNTSWLLVVASATAWAGGVYYLLTRH